MNDYSKLNLTNGMLAVNSPLNRKPQVLGADFDTQYEVQNKNVNITKFVNDSFIGVSNYSTGVGTVGAGTRVFVTATMAPVRKDPQSNYLAFGVPFLAIYEGTSVIGSNQIYPRQGGSVASGKYIIQSGFDFLNDVWNNGTNMYFAVTVHNTAGSAVPIFIEAQWKLTSHGRSVNQT